MSYFSELIVEHVNAVESLINVEEDLQRIAHLCCVALNNGKKLIFCGNGGSAADAQHIAAEFTGRFVNDREPLAALALTTDTSALTCIGNDYGFDQVFSRQLKALGQSGDIIFLISTSGASNNIKLALDTAKHLSIQTVALTGLKGEAFSKNCDHGISINSYTTARIQEAHIFILHVLCGLIEKEMNYE